MITRPLDALFTSADRLRDAGATLLTQITPEGRLHRSVARLMAALEQFDADLTLGRSLPATALPEKDETPSSHAPRRSVDYPCHTPFMGVQK